METSPLVTSLSWGSVTVAGHGTFKDVEVWPGGAREWDWAETGTRHQPGIQLDDVREILAHGADVVVLGRGVEEVLEVRARTVRSLELLGVEVHVAQSERAVELYNQLAATRAVGLLLHTTC